MALILVIDDDELFRLMLVELLIRSGYQVVAARDGREGAQLFHQAAPDLVITDLIMPEREGIETIIEIRKARPEIPIIAVSGGGRNQPEDYLPLAEAMGAACTFAKPFDRRAFLAAVARLVNRPATP
ncbi:MAG: response regulator [Thermodesulfobacteriota bacterium]